MAIGTGVVANCYSLNVRGGPSMSFGPIAWLQAGDNVTIESKSGGWYKLEGEEKYVYEKYINITEATKAEVTYTPVDHPPGDPVVPPSNEDAQVESNYVPVGEDGATFISSNEEAVSDGIINIDEYDYEDDDFYDSDNIKTSPGKLTSSDNYGIFYLHTNTEYPKLVSNDDNIPQYDWYMNYNINAGYSSTLISMYTEIQENMDLPSIYTREDINYNLHTNFNRFRIEYPDVLLRNTMSVVVFTRPDLNFFNESFDKNNMVSSDPRSNLILTENENLGRLLTAYGTGTESHKFNPLLSNMALNLEVTDDTLDLLETGETFTGYKMQYSKHNIKSITSGTFSIKYKETFDLSVTKMHQLWVDYMSNVYRGIFEPKREYIYNKELDYACDVYYFLLDQDGETIKFWTKYYGVFPNNVPKSIYGFDFGSQVSFPELNVTYSYIYKEDLSPTALIEFNNNAGVESGSDAYYVSSYDSSFGHSGKTWVGCPFIHEFYYNNGFDSNIQGFKIGWKKKE